jgi:hypothetical protein
MKVLKAKYLNALNLTSKKVIGTKIIKTKCIETRSLLQHLPGKPDFHGFLQPAKIRNARFIVSFLWHRYAVLKHLHNSSL